MIMNKSDDKLDQLLNSATPIPASTNLAERIIAESKRDALVKPQLQKRELGKKGIINQVLQNLIFPKPAFSLACSMLIGIFVGWQTPDFNRGIDNTSNAVQLMSVDEELSSLFVAEVNYYE